MDHDWIEGVVLLPENLFYNTPAPGVLLFLNRAKPQARRGRIILINASGEFMKGKPKNYIPEPNIHRIADTFLEGQEVEKFSRIVTADDAKANDYNLSPSRYIDLSDAAGHRPVSEILNELSAAESESRALTTELMSVLEHLGFHPGDRSYP